MKSQIPRHGKSGKKIEVDGAKYLQIREKLRDHKIDFLVQKDNKSPSALLDLFI